jgi:hypothetical protein
MGRVFKRPEAAAIGVQEEEPDAKKMDGWYIKYGTQQRSSVRVGTPCIAIIAIAV